MNPTAGSFFVDPRLQRWFWIVAIPFPESSSLNTIFAAFLNKHFSKFKGTIQELVAPVIKSALQLHGEVEKLRRVIVLQHMQMIFSYWNFFHNKIPFTVGNNVGIEFMHF